MLIFAIPSVERWLENLFSKKSEWKIERTEWEHPPSLMDKRLISCKIDKKKRKPIRGKAIWKPNTSYSNVNNDNDITHSYMTYMCV